MLSDEESRAVWRISSVSLSFSTLLSSTSWYLALQGVYNPWLGSGIGLGSQAPDVAYRVWEEAPRQFTAWIAVISSNLDQASLSWDTLGNRPGNYSSGTSWTTAHSARAHSDSSSQGKSSL